AATIQARRMPIKRSGAAGKTRDDGPNSSLSRPAVAGFVLRESLPTLDNELLDSLDLVGRRFGNTVDETENFPAADRADIDAEFLRLREICRVLMRCHERILQCLGAIGGHIGRRRKGTRQR